MGQKAMVHVGRIADVMRRFAWSVLSPAKRSGPQVVYVLGRPCGRPGQAYALEFRVSPNVWIAKRR